jgi:hypothetical protein
VLDPAKPVQVTKAATGDDANKTAISDRIGKSLRGYHEGDPFSMEYNPSRANVVLSRGANLIGDVKFG